VLSVAFARREGALRVAGVGGEFHAAEAATLRTALHVAAKRYLCAVDPAYYQQLSGPSRRSLALQGGAMAHRIEAAPHIHLCMGAGGAGMTMSFGLAEAAWRRWTGDRS
jgi:hypothetical protein